MPRFDNPNMSATEGPWEPDENGAVDYDPIEESTESRILQIKRDHEQRLLALPGIVGVGVGRTELGEDALMVYLENIEAAANLPKYIDGIAVVWEVTGPIELQDTSNNS